MGNAIPRLVVMGSIRMQAEQAMEGQGGKQHSSVASASVPVPHACVKFLSQLPLVIKWDLRVLK